MPGEAESICAESWSRTWGPVCLPSWEAYRGRGCWAFGQQKGIPLSPGWRHVPAPAQRDLARAARSGRQACLPLFNATRGRCQIHGCAQPCPSQWPRGQQTPPNPQLGTGWMGLPCPHEGSRSCGVEGRDKPTPLPLAPTAAPRRESRYQGSYKSLSPSLCPQQCCSSP